MASTAGSSSAGFFWATSRMRLSSRITSSSALMDFSRPTNSGTIMWGNTTISRSGRTGRVSALPGIARVFETLVVIFLPFAGLAAYFDHPQNLGCGLLAPSGHHASTLASHTQQPEPRLEMEVRD